MKEYELTPQEIKALIKIIYCERCNYFREKNKTNLVNIDNYEEYISESMQLEIQFYKDELVRFAKSYLSRKEYNIFKKAVYNAENLDELKRFLFKNKNYEYKILSKVLKKIGGLFYER